jgi:hypothetical protein
VVGRAGRAAFPGDRSGNVTVAEEPRRESSSCGAASVHTAADAAFAENRSA